MKKRSVIWLLFMFLVSCVPSQPIVPTASAPIQGKTVVVSMTPTIGVQASATSAFTHQGETGSPTLTTGGMSNTVEPIPTGKIKGISFPAWWKDTYSNPATLISLSNLQKTHATCVAVVPTIYQADENATTFSHTDNTATDDSVDTIIDEIHQRNLCVLLKPHVDLQDNKWRGTIGTTFTTDEWNTWFTNYQTELLHYATMAAAHNVELFSVGTELAQASKQSGQWHSLIASVRRVYTGKLVYSANQDEVYGITWWKQVDYIGVNPYYSLSESQTPSISEIESGWQSYKDRLQTLSETYSRPVLFTELGFRSIDFGLKDPWQYQGQGVVNLQTQANAYEAFFTTIWSSDWVAGVFFWYWDTDPNKGGVNDADYLPQGKPAEQILTQWWH